MIHFRDSEYVVLSTRCISFLMIHFTEGVMGLGKVYVLHA